MALYISCGGAALGVLQEEPYYSGSMLGPLRTYKKDGALGLSTSLAKQGLQFQKYQSQYHDCSYTTNST